MPVLETSRLTLREFVAEDADALAKILSDPETMRYYPAPYDHRGVEQWIARNRERYKNDGVGLWAMLLKSTGDLIGDCGITRQDVEGECLYEIGYHLRRDCWGQGLATEAAIACRNWGFQHLNADRLISLIRPENLPSCRVAERNGMTIWKKIDWRGLRHSVYSITKSQATVMEKGIIAERWSSAKRPVTLIRIFARRHHAQKSARRATRSLARRVRHQRPH